MKIIKITCVLLFAILSYSNAQNWNRKNVGNNVSVLFPSDVEYVLRTLGGKQIGSYICKTQNCAFMAMILYDVIPNYSEFVNLKKEEKNSIVNTLLDNVAQGKLMYSNSKANIESFKINGYQARRFAFSGVNPETGDVGKRYSTIIVVSNKVFSFECYFLTTKPQCNTEKETFFNSIRIN